MKIYFSWENVNGCLTPDCHSSVVNKDGVSLLACILMDDGGQPYLQTIPWLDDGLNRIVSIKNKEINFFDWSRETWGAELTHNEVKIYSLHDDNYFQLLKLEVFEQALIAWRGFLQSNPEAGVKTEIEI